MEKLASGAWTFWYMNKPANRGQLGTNYELHIQELLTVDTVGGLLSGISRLALPDADDGAAAISGDDQRRPTPKQATTALPQSIDIHFFRHGIKPTWEDAGNQGGGRFLIRLRKGVAPRLFEWLLLALSSTTRGQWGEQVCGVVLSTRFSEDILAVWCTRMIVESEFAGNAMRGQLRQTLALPAGHQIDLKPHEQSMQK
jgi:hypothetical protein